MLADLFGALVVDKNLSKLKHSVKECRDTFSTLLISLEVNT